MEREDDAQLVHAILSGDDSAFNILVGKYEKSVHALVWQKIGDFHYAQEITQDSFLRAYQKLSTLRNPSQFLGWLFVIANRLCLNWLQKQKSAKQFESLEDIPVEEVAKSDYARYVSEQRETEATEDRFKIVKKLLEKLPEGEQTVVTLHYLGEMTMKEISISLGVSVETVKVRLYRARERLREEEELLIQEVLGGVQIPASIKQNIMREVADMKPTPSPKMKPFLPWIAIGTAVVVATLLILSVSTPYLAHFQKLYSIDFTHNDEKDFAADFSLTLGTHRTGTDLLAALIEEKCRTSVWSAQALENPDFPVAAAEITAEIVIVSMREMGFAVGELATLDTIYARAKQMGLETCPVETAVQLRLRFLDQLDWTTGEQLSEFFVASEPFVLTRDGFPKIFSVVRDDRYPHPETGRGLWLIANGTVDAGDAERPDRLFNASDPEGSDHSGRFAFVIPK
ncbi:MAG: RNA polymerase sigma factor [Candidatus Poribacteria bacterium]|nr:RNA polymerase sigma factor [Candidatus Poribacteria bacterium]